MRDDRRYQLALTAGGTPPGIDSVAESVVEVSPGGEGSLAESVVAGLRASGLTPADLRARTLVVSSLSVAETLALYAGVAGFAGRHVDVATSAGIASLDRAARAGREALDAGKPSERADCVLVGGSEEDRAALEVELEAVAAERAAAVEAAAMEALSAATAVEAAIETPDAADVDAPDGHSDDASADTSGGTSADTSGGTSADTPAEGSGEAKTDRDERSSVRVVRIELGDVAAGVDPHLVSVLRWGKRVRLALSGGLDVELPRFAFLAGVRSWRGQERFPALADGTDLDGIRQDAGSLRRSLRSASGAALAETVELTERQERLSEAAAVDIAAVLVRLGSTTDGKLWQCPRPRRHTHGDATPSLRVDDNRVCCYVDDAEWVDPLRLVMDSLSVGPDDAADLLLDLDSSEWADRAAVIVAEREAKSARSR